jgi:WD40 repeat protein
MNISHEEILEKLILFLAHADEGITIAEYDTLVRRDSLIAASQKDSRLKSSHTAIVDIELFSTDYPPHVVLEHFIQRNSDVENLFVIGLESRISDDQRLATFNLTREAWDFPGKKIVLWLPAGAVQSFFHQAKDFFRWLSPRFDFTVISSKKTMKKETRVQAGKESYEKGHSFEEQVAELYRMIGFNVEIDRLIGGRQIDLVLRQNIGTMTIPFIVECKSYQVAMDDLDKFRLKLDLAKKKNPRYLGIMVSNTGFARNCREAAEEAGVECVLFSDLSRSLIDFTAYTKTLVKDFKNSELARLYIEPCVRREGKEDTEEAGSFLDQWLNRPEARQITLLGDYGTGKTSLARKLAHDLGEKHLKDPTQPVPVLVNLREAKSSLGLENLVIHHLQTHGIERASFKAFWHLLEQGFIVLIFDGFDELVTRTNARLTLENLRELNRAVTGNSKVLLTCRTHYFRDTEEEKRLIGTDQKPGLSEGSTDLYREISNRPEFKIVYLHEFSENQVKEYFNKIFGPLGPENYRIMKGIYHLEKLSKRPVLLDMIVKSLGKMAENKKTLRPAELYDTYTRLWIDRNDWRNVLSPEEKMIFVEELAFLLWEGETDFIHHRELSGVLKSHFKETIRESMEMEFADYEVRTATFLQRDSEGNYSFSHRSFMEFFLVKRLIRLFAHRGIDALAMRRLSPEVLGFLTDLVMEKKEDWVRAANSLLTRGYRPKTSENAFLLLVSLYRKIDPDSPPHLPAGSKLPGAQLAGTDLENIVLQQADLKGTDFRTADLSGSDLCGCDLTGSVLASAVLTGVKLEGTVLKGADCSGAQMRELNLSGKDLQGCKLRLADLRGADLSKAILDRVDVSYANLEGACLCGAHLEGTDFTGAYLVRADFTAARRKDAKFIRTAFKEVRGLDTLKKKVPWGAGPGTSLANLGLEIVSGHNRPVNSVVFSPDGHLVASASSDHTVKLWEVETGRLIKTLSGHSDDVRGVSFSPDSRLLASASSDHTVKVWQVENGSLIKTLEGHSNWINGVSFSPDSRILASASSDNTVNLWQVKTGTLIKILEGHSDWINSVSFSPDSRFLASASSDYTVKLWQVETGTLIKTLEGHSNSVNGVSFSTDSRLLASASWDNTVKLWQVETGSLIKTLEGHSDIVYGVSISPDSRILASASSDYTVKLWQVETGTLIKTLEGHSNSVNGVSFSTDSRILASASSDKTVKLWQVETGDLIKTLEGHFGIVTGVSFSTDSRILASASSDNTVKLWQVETGRLPKTLEGHSINVNGVSFSPDNRILASASADHTVKLWEVETGSLIKTLAGHSNWVNGVSFSPDNRILASASADHTVKLWQVGTGSLIKTLKGHSNWVNGISFSTDNRILASASDDYTVKLWQVGTGSLIKTLEGHFRDVNDVSFSPDSRILASASSDNTVKLWQVETGNLIKTLEGHIGSVNGVSFSPDSQILASASWDNTVKLWQVETGRLIKTLEGHSGGVYDVSFSPDSRILASASLDNTVKLWDVNTGQCLLTFYTFDPHTWLTYTPGKYYTGHDRALSQIQFVENLAIYPAREFEKEFHKPEKIKEILAPYFKGKLSRMLLEERQKDKEKEA